MARRARRPGRLRRRARPRRCRPTRSRRICCAAIDAAPPCGDARRAYERDRSVGGDQPPRSTSRVGGRAAPRGSASPLGTPHLALAGAVLAAIFIAVPLLASLVSERATVTWFVALAPAVPIAAAVIAYATADRSGRRTPAPQRRSTRSGSSCSARRILLAAVLPVGLLASVLLPVPHLARARLVPPGRGGLRGRARRRHPVRPGVGCRNARRRLGGRGARRVRPVARAAVDRGARTAERQPAGRADRQSSIVAVAAGAWFVVRRDDVTYRVSP